MPGPPKTLTEADRKRQKVEQERRRRARQINIGDVIHDWKKLKESLGLSKDSELARKLIESFYTLKDYEQASHGTAGQLLKSRYGGQTEYEYREVKTEIFNVDTSTQVDHLPSRISEASMYDNNTIIKTEQFSDDTESVKEQSKDEENDEFVDMFEQNVEMIAVPESADKVEGIRTRLKSRGFRPNYASLEKWNDKLLKASDIEENDEMVIDQTANDLDTNSVDVEEMKIKNADMDQTVNEINSNSVDIGEGITAKGAEISVSQNESIKKKGKKKAVVDPDFDPEIDDFDCETKNESDTDEDSLFDDSNKDVNEKEPKKRKFKNGKGTVKEVKKSPKKPWIGIKLEDHSDKFRIETVGSFERKNRGCNVVEELYTCLQCGQFKSIDRDLFERHIENHVNGLLDCSECSFVGRSEAQIRNHEKSHGHLSNRSKKFVCDICGVVLFSRDARINHMGKVHDDPQLGCRYCDVKLPTFFKRQQHIRAEHADMAQFCNICKTDFHTSTVEEFMTHKTSCKPGHPCPVCGKILVSKYGLTVHIKTTHMSVRKYQCNLCQYAAKSAMRLREHTLTHSSSHPYSCDQCSFTCIQAYQLTSHQRTHTGDKPYKCTQCNFAAAWNVQLKEHVKVHLMSTAVSCDLCNILFKNDNAKRIHEKKDH